MYIAFTLVVIAAVHSINADDKIVTLSRARDDCLYGNNVIRTVHNESPLTSSEDLSNGAEDWAIRIALKGEMAHSNRRVGENLYESQGMSDDCANPLFSWYQGIKAFDYDHPQWTFACGTFIQEVYSKVTSVGVGIASYNNKLFAVGFYDYAILTSDPMDQAHVPKPSRAITKNDLMPKTAKQKQIISIPIPDSESQVWTDWVATSSCSTNCGVGSSVEERWCVHGDFMKDCVGERKRTVECKVKECNGNTCHDSHKDCAAYAHEKQYCHHKLYANWMKQNCPKSCGLCKEENNDESLYDAHIIARGDILKL